MTSEQTYRDFDSMVALAKRHGLEVVAVSQFRTCLPLPQLPGSTC